MNEEAVRNGFVTTPKGRKIPLEWIEQPNAQKFFNYILQATETEFNIEVLKKLVENDTVPILYTYDSFLFELSDKNQVEGIKAVLESYGFPVRMDVGNNYSEV